MSKKAVRLGRFLQCSVHIFLGHDSCFTNQFKNFVEPYHEELSSKAWSMWQHYIPQQHHISQTLALLTVGFFTFGRSWNLSTSLSQNSMPCSTYLWGGLIKNKEGVGLFQISQKERVFVHVLYQPSDNRAM